MGGITDDNLSEVLKMLRPSERKVIARHVLGDPSEESNAILRRIKASLKRKARKRLPRKLVWLE